MRVKVRKNTHSMLENITSKKIRFRANFLYTFAYLQSTTMSQLSRQEFTDKVQDYIKRINQIAEEQGYSVMMAYYIEGSENEPDDFIIDWRNMNLNDNLYALSRWSQDVMNNFDEDSGEEGRFGF